MGLLDMMGASWDDPKTAATLNLAAGLLSTRGIGGLVNGMQGYAGTLAQAKRAAQEEAERKQIAEMRAMQLQQMQAQAAAQAAAQQRMAAFQGDVQKELMLTTPTQALAGGGGPTVENAARVGEQKPANWAALAAKYPDQFEMISKLATVPNLGRNKVARTVKGMGPDGREYEYQVDEYGNRVGDGLAQWKAPIEVNQGDRKTFANPYTGESVFGFRVNQSPDSVASNALGWSNNDLARQRLNLDRDRLERERPNAQVINDPERGVLIVDKNSGLVRPGVGMDGKPVSGENVVKREKASQRVIPAIDAAINKLERGEATASLFGTGVDIGLGAVGLSTKGGQGAAQLKALEGQIMMNQPRMEGPQSDKDVQLYRQMAGQVGDSRIPAETRIAALKTIRSLHEKYGGVKPASGASRTLDDLLNQYGGN